MLEERIRTHIEDIAAPVTIDHVHKLVASDAPMQQIVAPGEIAWSFEGEQREIETPQRSWLAVAAAVAFLAVLSGAAFFGLRPDSEVVASNPPGTAFAAGERNLPELPGDLSEARWVDVTGGFPELEAGVSFEFLDVLSSDGVVWAVGHTFETLDLTEGSAASQSAIWRSENGTDWTSIDLGIDESVGADSDDPSILEHLVATDDGAIWAFGSRFRFGDNPESDAAEPFSYRTIDGEAWVPVEIPFEEGVPTLIDSVDAEGNAVLVVLSESDIFAVGGVDNAWRTLTTTSGSEWLVVSESSLSALALFEDGVVRDILGADVEGELELSFLARGPGFSVAVGIEDGFNENENVFTTERDAAVLLSVDGEPWRLVDRPTPQRENEFPTGLFPHDEGVLAAIHWVDDGERGVDLWNIDERGTVADLGDLPVSWLNGMFVHQGSIFLIDQPPTDSLSSDEIAESTPRIWVADFLDTTVEPNGEADGQSVGQDPLVEEEEAAEEIAAEQGWPDQDDRVAVSPVGINRAGGLGVGLTPGGALLSVDLSTGDTTSLVQLPNEAIFYEDLELNWDGTAVYVHEIVEDSWFRCETEGGAIRRIDLSTGTSELIGMGSEPNISSDGTQLAYLASTDCIPDPREPGNWVLAVRDTIVVRDLATGAERSWVDEEIASLLGSLDSQALDTGQVGLSGLTWIGAEQLAVGDRRIEASTMTALPTGVDLNVVPFVPVIGASANTDDVVLFNGQLILVNRDTADLRLFGEASTAAFDASNENLAVLDESTLYVDGRGLKLAVELQMFDW